MKRYYEIPDVQVQILWMEGTILAGSGQDLEEEEEKDPW